MPVAMTAIWAMLVGVAGMLVNEPPPGDVILLFQPGEETGEGAKVMLDTEALQRVRMIFAGHMTRHYRVGEIMVPRGLVSARSDRFSIRIEGRGGHGARPHEGIDAVVAAGALIMGIQTLVSREVDPFHPSVVSIGTVQAGDAPNVIAGEASLEGIIRTTNDQSRDRIIDGLHRIARATGEAHSARVDVSLRTMCPPVINDEEPTELARRAALRVVGEERLVLTEEPSMGADDFSYYLEQIPGCYVRFGARRDDWPDIPLHSPRFDFDENLLKVGAAYYDSLVREALNALTQRR